MVGYKHCNLERELHSPVMHAHGYGLGFSVTLNPITYLVTATVNQHPPVHHPLDARYYSVVNEPQLS
jgi:hypothetical protein